MKEIAIQERNELKAYFKSNEVEKAMYCAENIGLYGIAAKIAEQRKEFGLAGKFFEKFGNFKRASSNYAKSDDSSYLDNYLGIAKKMGD